MSRALAVVLSIVTAVAACGRQPSEPGGGADLPAGGPAPTTGAAPAAPTTATPGAPTTAAAEPARIAPPPPAGALTEAQVAAIGERMLGLMEQVTVAVEGAGADCGAMAGAIEGVITANQAVLDELRADRDGEGDDALFDAWMAKQQSRASALAARLEGPMNRCADDPRLAAALGKLAP